MEGHEQGAVSATVPVQPRRNPVAAVLGQSELLEVILDHAIHAGTAEERVNTLCSVRLVNKSWLTAVTTVMRLNKEPLFKLTLNKNNSLNGTPSVEATGKLLDTFVKTIGRRIEKPFPTFKLIISKEFFRKENYNSLAACLIQCGQGLVTLEMTIPKNGGTLPGMFSQPQIVLPMLHTISVSFNEKPLAMNVDELAFGHSMNALFLIQFLISKASSLKTFEIPRVTPRLFPTRFLLPPGIEFLCLPMTITNLELSCPLRNNDLELLVRNKLPCLASLRLTIHGALNPGLVDSVLDNFQKTVETLLVSSVGYPGPPRIANFVRFPVMQKLKVLQICSIYFELEDNHPPLFPLSNCFPELECLNLVCQTPEMLHKWTNSSVLNSLNKLALLIVDEDLQDSNPNFPLPINLETMQRVHLAFPNVTKLLLALHGESTCGLKYLYMEMRQLTSLTLFFYGRDLMNNNADLFDSLLLGVPVALVTVLRENSNCFKVLEFKDELPSIRMLTELKSLKLMELRQSNRQPEPLISDLTFTYGLLKMEQLENLDLSGRFQASNEMTVEWKRLGRTIEYKP